MTLWIGSLARLHVKWKHNISSFVRPMILNHTATNWKNIYFQILTKKDCAFWKSIVAIFIYNRASFNFEFLICQLTTWFNGHAVNERSSFSLNYHSTKLWNHRSCRRGDITFWIFDVNSKDYVARGSCYSIGGFLSPWVTTLPSLLEIHLIKKQILCFQLTTTSCDDVIRESRNFILGFTSPLVSTMQRLAVIRSLEKEIFRF